MLLLAVPDPETAPPSVTAVTSTLPLLDDALACMMLFAKVSCVTLLTDAA